MKSTIRNQIHKAEQLQNAKAVSQKFSLPKGESSALSKVGLGTKSQIQVKKQYS